MSAAAAAPHIGVMTIPIVAEYDGYQHANHLAAMPRSVNKRVCLAHPIQIVDRAEAPVAARIPDAFNYVPVEPRTTEIRLVDGNLYRPLEYVGGTPVTPENAGLNEAEGIWTGCYETEDDAQAAVAREAGDLILIDGELWARTAEPVLAVRGRRVRATIEPNEYDTVYPLTRYQDAVEAARVALDTSTQNLMPEPELLIPEVFTEPSALDTGVAMHHALEELLPLTESLLAFPTGSKMLQTAARLIELARQYDEAVCPAALKPVTDVKEAR